jgi:hypothetical protein
MTPYGFLNLGVGFFNFLGFSLFFLTTGKGKYLKGKLRSFGPEF